MGMANVRNGMSVTAPTISLTFLSIYANYFNPAVKMSSYGFIAQRLKIVPKVFLLKDIDIVTSIIFIIIIILKNQVESLEGEFSTIVDLAFTSVKAQSGSPNLKVYNGP